MERVRLRTGAVCRQPIPLDAAAVCGEGSASTAILVPIEFNPKCHAILMGNLSRYVKSLIWMEAIEEMEDWSHAGESLSALSLSPPGAGVPERETMSSYPLASDGQGGDRSATTKQRTRSSRIQAT